MRIAYFDCFSGISGDMCLGALVDAGAPFAELKAALGGLGLAGYRLEAHRVVRCGYAATKVDVVIDKHRHAHDVDWADISAVIAASALPDKIREKGLAVFRRLFEAEGAVHGAPFDAVHLHELGGIDCLVDVFGALIGLDLLGIERVYSSAVNLGSGTVKTRHGILPVPAPATAELLKGRPVYASEIPFELTTPTGAVLLTTLGAEFGPLPLLRIDRIGYGAGGKDFTTSPNVLRLLVGDAAGGAQRAETAEDRVALIETNIDDMNPQLYEEVMERLLGAGALDVFLETIIMKKGRPAVKVSVLAAERDADSLADLLFSETTTIGVRFSTVRRKTLRREIATVETSLGPVRVKVSKIGDAVATVTPEYDDLKALARKTGLPLKQLSQQILAEARAAVIGGSPPTS